jgi:hypothetical protein
MGISHQRGGIVVLMYWDFGGYGWGIRGDFGMIGRWLPDEATLREGRWKMMLLGQGWVVRLGLVLATATGALGIQPRLGEPLPGLTAEQLDRFFAGKLEFRRDIDNTEGLGPTFNDDRCSACHSSGAVGGSSTQIAVRIGTMTPRGFDPLIELGGPIRQLRFIEGACEETLPIEATIVAERLATPVFGVGLVEAIPDADIIAVAMNQPPGIFGRVHFVESPSDPDGPLRVGRFGWKSQIATVLDFSADAAVNEAGLTNRIFPDENPPNGDLSLLAICDSVPDPEDGPDEEGFHFIDRVTDFQRFLGPPPQAPRHGMMGEDIFVEIGCADCHLVTPFVTGDVEEPALSHVEIKPYSDFLLHDMGSLADGIGQDDALPSEMRTAPLWGLRVRPVFNHSGIGGGLPFEFRVGAAIFQHDGEAAAARDAYNALSAEDQGLVISFLASLGRLEFDLDDDADVDLVDFAEFQLCFTGPGQFITADDPCALADNDLDGDVDLADFSAFQLAFTGDL